MALIESQTIIEEGSKPTFTSLTALTNTFDNGGKQFIVATYTGEGSIDLEVTATVTNVRLDGYGDLTKTDPKISISSGETAYMGTFPTASYNLPDGTVEFVVTAYTNVSVAILEL